MQLSAASHFFPIIREPVRRCNDIGLFYAQGIYIPDYRPKISYVVRLFDDCYEILAAELLNPFSPCAQRGL